MVNEMDYVLFLVFVISLPCVAHFMTALFMANAEKFVNVMVCIARRMLVSFSWTS